MRWEGDKKDYAQDDDRGGSKVDEARMSEGSDGSLEHVTGSGY